LATANTLTSLIAIDTLGDTPKTSGFSDREAVPNFAFQEELDESAIGNLTLVKI
jgi:hypothetical protein